MNREENMRRRENKIVFSAWPPNTLPIEEGYANIALWSHQFKHYLKWFTNSGIEIVKA